MAHYMDTSALVKLIVDEPETGALREWLAVEAREPVSCDLARTELLRVVRRTAPDRAVAARRTAPDRAVAARQTAPDRAVAARRTAPDRAVAARRLLEAVTLTQVTTAVFEQAGRLDPASLRSLDAIHLAAALDLGDDLDGLVTYDSVLARAAASAGIEVTAPA